VKEPVLAALPQAGFLTRSNQEIIEFKRAAIALATSPRGRSNQEIIEFDAVVFQIDRQDPCFEAIKR
jgi:hypothetical protein